MTRKRRLSIFLSVVWFTLTGIFASDTWNPIGEILTVGFLPLLLVWGSWWVIAGGRRDSPLVKHNESQKEDSARLASSKVDKENIQRRKGSNWVIRAVCILLVGVAVAVFASVITKKPAIVDQTNTEIAEKIFLDSLSVDQLKLYLKALEAPSAERQQEKK